MSWKLAAGSLCAVAGIAIGLWVAQNNDHKVTVDQVNNNVGQQELSNSLGKVENTDKSEELAESSNLPVPKKKPQPPKSDGTPVVFWQETGQQQTVDKFDIPVDHLQVNPSYIEQIQVGQVLEFPIPELNKSFITKLTDTANSFNDVHVWTGVIVDGDPTENVIVTRGKTQTHITISSREGIYSAVIDNGSGKTQIINENNIKAAVDEPPAVSGGNLQAPQER
ncbi:hypothetical protein H0A36_11365 [Endozoicomonas sp. SM1973]|uniref:LysM domain-containing protein n=1 Tax=Spartinivicinus marinus TaxID=2994442 RepID=A0A853I7H6_9GAMM|nr:hypothetical protein [Spartinivicinus marinus]MCX4026125.1 hypothetical protein [Spartinivicinus marinus]NYZ66608.1 hypothetical protein [Spartinivicinus marinus]